MINEKKKRWQRWRYTFELNKISLDKNLTLKFGRSTLFLKPKTKTKCSGYYQISFMDNAINEHKAKEIIKEDFEYFLKLLILRSISPLKPKWKIIGRIGETKWKYEKTRRFKHNNNRQNYTSHLIRK